MFHSDPFIAHITFDLKGQRSKVKDAKMPKSFFLTNSAANDQIYFE